MNYTAPQTFSDTRHTCAQRWPHSQRYHHFRNAAENEAFPDHIRPGIRADGAGFALGVHEIRNWC